MFSLTFLLLLYAKHCKRHGIGVYNQTDLSIGAASPAPPPPLIQGRDSGVDRAIIEILPTFSFASLHGLKDGLECAVCLSRFDSPDILRLLPKCKHAFHLECVDTWLGSHSTCPLCRNRVEADDVFFVEDLVKCHISDERARNSSARRPSSVGRSSNAEASAGFDTEFHVYVQRDTDDVRVQHRDDPKSSKESLRKSSSRKLKNGKAAFDPQEFTKRFGHRIIIADALSQRRWSDFIPSDALFLSSQHHFGGYGALRSNAVTDIRTSTSSSNLDSKPYALKDSYDSDVSAHQQAPRHSLGGRGDMTSGNSLSLLSASRKDEEDMPSSCNVDAPARMSSSKIQDIILSRLSTSRSVESGLLSSGNRDVEVAADASCTKQARGEGKHGIFERQTSFLRRAFAAGRENPSSSTSMQMPSYRRSVSEVSGIKRFAESGKNAALSSDEEAKQQWFSIARRTLTWIMGGGKDRPFLQMPGRPG